MDKVVDLNKISLTNENYKRIIFSGNRFEYFFLNINSGENFGWRNTKKSVWIIRCEFGFGKVHVEKKYYCIFKDKVVIVDEKKLFDITNNSENINLLISVYKILTE